jgi:hypothetical protein
MHIDESELKVLSLWISPNIENGAERDPKHAIICKAISLYNISEAGVNQLTLDFNITFSNKTSDEEMVKAQFEKTCYYQGIINLLDAHSSVNNYLDTVMLQITNYLMSQAGIPINSIKLTTDSLISSKDLIELGNKFVDKIMKQN